MNVDIKPVDVEPSARQICCVPIRAKRLTKTDAEAAAELFKALSDPHRIRIFNLLSNSDEPVCVCDITAELDVGQPTASFHLKKLMAAGLLDRMKVGTWAYYSINEEASKAISRVLDMKGSKR